MSDNPKSLEPIGSSKKIDIFQHLLQNLKTQNLNCKDDNISSTYCIPCKVSVCESCAWEEHKKHIWINKVDFELNENNIDRIYDDLQNILISKELFSNYQPFKTELIKNIDKMIEKLKAKLEQLKELKLKEIFSLFNGFQDSISNLKEKIEKSRTELKQYYKKNKKLFNFPTDNSSNQPSPMKSERASNIDSANSIFLINYELLNISQIKGKEIKALTNSIEKSLEDYKVKQNEYIDTLLGNAEHIFFSDYESDLNNHYNNNHLSQETSSIYLFKQEFNKLNYNNLEEIPKRISQYNNMFDTFRRTVFDSVTKYNNWKEIKTCIDSFEKKKVAEQEMLFSKKSKEKASKSNKSELALLKMKYLSKDDIVLNNEILEKYFSCWVLNTYEKYFKTQSKELQSSHADLMIKKNEDDDYIKDFGKAIENTNWIMLYYRKDQQIVKQLIKWKKNPMGYTKFPYGVRSWLIGDKLYITGGKGDNEVYKNVIIYDRITGKIKRIMDLNEPHCYHTLAYCELFQTLLVLGGENSTCVEIFDPITNRWAKLPYLNSPRANVVFQFDKLRGKMYALFGNKNWIVNDEYSSEIEYMNLKSLTSGWAKLEYNNKAEADFKTYLSVIEINNDLVWIYGGFGSRDTTRIVCLLNRETHEVTQCDKKMLERLREETKNSKRMSKIISGLSAG